MGAARTSTLRTKEQAERYAAHRAVGGNDMGCPLCGETAIDEFTYWRVIQNNFPYDTIAAVHHMLVPKRHVTERELAPEEQAELFTIKNDHLGAYDYILEATPARKSLPAHFHLHLIILKD